MHRFSLAGLSILLLTSAAIPAAQAQAQNRIQQQIKATEFVNRSAPIRHTSVEQVQNRIQQQLQAGQFMPDNLNRELTPFELVSLANQGYFKNQGIPSYGALLQQYYQGTIRAKDLVQSAIKTNRLSADFLTNQSYVSAVENSLKALEIH